MKIKHLQVATAPNRSFAVRRDFVRNINSVWHCHTEVELIHFYRGSGMQFVGDNMSRFKPGDVVLVGSRLPHYFHYDHEERLAEPERADLPYSTAIQFTEDFWGSQFLNLPENIPLRRVLERAKRGLQLTGQVGEQVAHLIEKLVQTEGTHRLILLIECLLTANQCEDIHQLASMGFQREEFDVEDTRLHAVYKYTLANFHKRIQLEEVASLAGLVPNAFCRYFKWRTGKSYVQFLTEIRVGNACKLLIDNSLPIKQICYECGFNNFTCFHKKFKHITGQSPLLFQRSYLLNSGVAA